MLSIPHNKPTLELEEQFAAHRVLSSGWVAQGDEVASFEADLCNYFDLPPGHCVLVSSGSSAIYLALWALDTSVGAKIGLPAYSCAALRNAVGMLGGRCIFLDCAKNSPNLSIYQAQQEHLDVLIAPSMFGIPLELTMSPNYRVIEDLAQALGAKKEGSLIGLRGDIGVCSFYATKLITSGGQGGAVLSKDKSLIDKIRDYREFDCRRDNKLRFNFQMTDIQAAIGRVQLMKLPKFLKKREEIFQAYRDSGLNMISGPEGTVRYRAVIRTPEPKKMIEMLAKKNIRAIVPIEEFELLDQPFKYPEAQKLTNSTVSLPIYPSLTSEQLNKIISILKVYS